MPGTTYRRSGPTQDPAGRLADFARFAEEELKEISAALAVNGYESMPPGGPGLVSQFSGAARTVADKLSGFTTADDPHGDEAEA